MQGTVWQALNMNRERRIKPLEEDPGCRGKSNLIFLQCLAESLFSQQINILFFDPSLRKTVIVKFSGVKITSIIIIAVFCMMIVFQNDHINILYQAIYVFFLLTSSVKNI